MKGFLSKVLAFFAIAVLLTAFNPQNAGAAAHILWHTEHIYLDSPGEATVVGYFENDGDGAGTVSWMEFDLTFTADNGQQMWADTGIRHYPDGIEVWPGNYVEYTFYINNPNIPEYHGKYRWRTTNNRTHWQNAVG